MITWNRDPPKTVLIRFISLCSWVREYFPRYQWRYVVDESFSRHYAKRIKFLRTFSFCKSISLCNFNQPKCDAIDKSILKPHENCGDKNWTLNENDKQLNATRSLATAVRDNSSPAFTTSFSFTEIEQYCFCHLRQSTATHLYAIMFGRHVCHMRVSGCVCWRGSLITLDLDLTIVFANKNSFFFVVSEKNNRIKISET